MSIKTSWSGPNKAFVREAKLKFFKEVVDNPTILSFPGTEFRLEKLLIECGYVAPEKILGIQTNNRIGNTKGSDIVKIMVEKLETLGWSMPLFIGDFSEFASSFGGEEKFNILDLDFCCPFTPANATGIEDLYRFDCLQESGCLVINHMKGREKPLETKTYLDKTFTRFGYPVPSFTIGGDVFRYSIIPAFYIQQALQYKYNLVLKELIEYRDKNEDTGLAVNMIQYFFTFRQTSNNIIRHNSLRQNSNNINRLLKLVCQSKKLSLVETNLYTKMLT